MYMPSVTEVVAQQLLDQELSWEEILKYCERHQTMLCNWVPETMVDVEFRAHTYRLCRRNQEWYAMNSTL